MNASSTAPSIHAHSHPRPSPAPRRRALHLVGSLPPEIAVDEQSAMTWALDRAAGTELTALPADRDCNWVARYLRDLRGVPALELVRDGAFTDQDDFPFYRRTPRRTLAPDDLILGRVAECEAAMAAHRRLTASYGRLPPHQISIPAPLDLAAYTFGLPLAARGQLSRGAALSAFRATLQTLPLFSTAIVEEIREIHSRWDQQVTFQLESTIGCAAYHWIPALLQPLLTRFLINATVRVLEAIPDRALVILHTWCYGDFRNTTVAPVDTLTPVVTAANRLAARLRATGRAVPPQHIALCSVDTAPAVDPDFYRPLTQLASDIPVIAGIVDERHRAASATALGLTESALGRPVAAVAAPCGLGRRTAEQAAANVRLGTDLAHTTARAVGAVSAHRDAEASPARTSTGHS